LPAQLQKEATVNENFSVFDLAVCAAADGFLVDSPPTNPAVGNSYVLGGSPSGVWAGHAHALAGHTSGGWRFIAPFDGLTVLDKASGQFATFSGGTWEKGNVRAAKVSIDGNQVVGGRLAAVADPAGGGVIDAEARSAIAAVLARLRQHGLINS
jgi:Protein of unknown function (DUF2793)